MSRLSVRARRRLQRIARSATPVVASATTAFRRGPPIGSIATVARTLVNAVGKGAGESDVEVDEAVAAETAAQLEVILGRDDRIRIRPTNKAPWLRYCALRITFSSGRSYRGTGFFIGPRIVATAGHCVYLHSEGGWATSVEVIPAMDGPTRPFGTVKSSNLRSVRGWVIGKKPESDYGCIILPQGAFNGRNLGRFGFAAFDAQTLVAQPAVLAGYPGDKPFAELWGMSRKIKTVTAKTLIYDIDTYGGQSGAPVYIKRKGIRYVVGIHNYGATSGNSATRVTKDVYTRLKAWSQIA